MNILYLSNHLNIGGITSYILTLAGGMKKRGHAVYLASSGGKLLAKFMDLGVVFIPIPIKTKKEINPKILFSGLKLSAFIKKYDIDIVHSHSRTTQILGSLLNRYMRIHHIWTCHGFFKRRFLRLLFPCWPDRIIAISESVRQHLREDFAVNDKDIRVINNGVDVERFRIQNPESQIEIKKNLGLGKASVVGIIARLSEEKGHLYLIKAMQTVVSQLPQTQLLIVGEGRMKQKLLNLSKELDLEKNIFFLPSVIDTKEVLSIMDLFVLPSLKEGLGLALMEAMACGLAVIGSEVGGIKSLIQDGFNGCLVKPADSDGLARAILELLKNPEKMESYGKQAQEFIASHFSQEKMVLETERVYLECLNPRD